MRKERKRYSRMPIAGLALVLLVAGLGSPAWGQDYTDIYVLGNPATTIARHHATDAGELGDLVTLHEFELREAIKLSGLAGQCGRSVRCPSLGQTGRRYGHPPHGSAG